MKDKGNSKHSTLVRTASGRGIAQQLAYLKGGTKMKFTVDKLEEIQKAYDKIQMEDKTYKYGLGVTIADKGLNGTGVMLNSDRFVFVEVEDLRQLIYELVNMKKAIEETTGLIL